MNDAATLERFFRGLAVDFWRACVPPEATAAEVALCRTALRLGAGSRLLDVPCGAGRHAVPLARLGVRVTGVDLSEELLAAAAAAADGLPVELHRRDMADLPWPGAFDAVACLGNSLGYTGHEGAAAFLAAAGRCLRAGGRMLLDTSMTAESLLPHLPDRIDMEAGGVRMVAGSRYDAPAGRMVITYRFSRGGQVTEATLPQAVFTAGELGRMLRAAGLVPLEWLGGTDGRPFAVGEGRLIVIAERR